MNSKEYNDTFTNLIAERLTEDHAVRMASEISDKPEHMLMYGLLQIMNRVEKAQTAQSALYAKLETFIDSVQPMMAMAQKQLMIDNEFEAENPEEYKELRRLRRENELEHLRQDKARREADRKLDAERHETEAKRLERKARMDALRDAEDDRRERAAILGNWIAKAGQKFEVKQSLGPDMPNIHVGNTLEIKYIDCTGDKKSYSREPKIVMEQGVILEEYVFKNMLEHEVLVPCEK